MAPQRHVERDNGMRRISSTTRWLAGVGFALVAAFSLYFGERASSASSSSSSTPAVTAPIATAAPATDAGSSASPSPQPTQTAPPITYPPQRHTRSSGS